MKMRMMMIVVALLLSLAAVGFAEDLPAAPSSARSAQRPDGESQVKPEAHVYLSPFKDPFFWAGSAFHASSVLADVAHVRACERALTCVEAYPPADQYRYRVPEIGFIVAADYACSLMLHDHHRWRAVCMVLPAVIGVAHWRDATRIYKNQV